MHSPAGPFAGDELRALARALLEASGVAAADATIVAEEVVDAQERGYDSQGLVRLPSYVGWARDGSIRSPARATVVASTPATLTIDGGFGWGHVVTLRAMEQCIERARETGACIATVRDVPHNGRLGWYVEAAAAAGMIGFLAGSGDPGSATMAPWGGREPRLSTNPFAIGFPNPRGGAPVIIDISTTQAARGKVLLAAANGEALPDGWAFDADGQPTTDPDRALPPDGTLAPLGGHKGYALAIMVELLCGGLGASYPPTEGALFVATIDPTAVTTAEAFAAAVADVEASMASSAPRPGYHEVLLPGAGSARRTAVSAAEGVHVAAPVWADISALADELGVPIPASARA
jgi:LDH2 family malate/lactate/ureidoglycolate dehydrogenase